MSSLVILVFTCHAEKSSNVGKNLPPKLGNNCTTVPLNPLHRSPSSWFGTDQGKEPQCIREV